MQAVANDIEVRLPIDTRRPDPDIAAAAVRALQWDTSVPADQIQVTVHRRQRLGDSARRGRVGVRAARRRARRARADRRPGVTNLITVRPRRPTPEQLREQIEGALIRTAETDAENVNVTIEGDTVILTGGVRSSAEKQEAEHVAWSAPGVVAVDNRIVVG